MLKNYLSPQAYESLQAEKVARLRAKFKPPAWTPNEGPQSEAYHTAADELFYGGAAGGGKTDLLLGAAGTAHWRSIIFRRVFPSIRAMIERSREIYNSEDRSHAKDSYNESLHIWRLENGRMIEFGSMQYEKDVQNYRGRPYDLYGFDEITEFSENQYRFVTRWNRSTKEGQRCRIICTGNPPSDASGEWVIKYWGPWLDDQHKNPAKPGELRWFAMVDGQDIEVEGADPFDYKGETLYPKSRTFIPALLKDNPYLRDTGYLATVMASPEPLRSQLLYGDFSVGQKDDKWQVIPTAWLLAAQNRWKEDEKPPVLMRSAGVDVARGGDNLTAIAPLYGNFFDQLITYPGSETPDGQGAAGLILQAVPPKVPIFIDGIGVGSSVYDQLKDHKNVDVTPVNNGSRASGTDKSGRYEFVNVRSQSYWMLREALDPANGENIALPPGREIRVDLCAPRYKLSGGRIAIEPKEDIIKRTGRSPDWGDAIVLAWYGANKPYETDLEEATDLPEWVTNIRRR